MIGQKLDELLKSKGIKAGTLATMTGISKSTIYSIIKRNNKNVDYSAIEKIADALEVPVEYFQGRSDSEKKDQPAILKDDELEEFVFLFEKLTADEKKFILSSMQGILASKESSPYLPETAE